MNIQIRKFSEIDNETLYQILKLRVDVFVVEQKCAYPEIDNMDQEALHFYVEEEGQISGYLRIYFRGPVKSVIGRVITHPDYRKKGISRSLMSQSLKYLKKDTKVQFIYLQAQLYLQDFYESFGFKAISDDYLEDGIPHVDMEMNIR